MARADVIISDGGATTYSGASSRNIFQTSAGVIYVVYVDGISDVCFRKSSDGGFTWTSPTVIFAGTTTALSCCWDKDAGLAGGLIHCAYTESGGADTLYRTIDTASSDALSTQTTIFAGASTAGGGALSITRSRGGNVYCKTMIDAGTEGGFYKLLNANVPNGAWEAALTDTEALASTDQWILVPGFAADSNDIMCVFWDASADQISRYIYDDSANTWAETIFGAPMTFVDTTAASYPHFAVAIDSTNSQILVVAWNRVDFVNSDLTCWTMTESAITACTDVVTDSTDDQGLCGITLDTTTGYWWVFYCGKSDGSETFSTSINVYYKSSTDSGATWGAETILNTLGAGPINSIVPIQRILSAVATPPPCTYFSNVTQNDTWNINVDLPVAGGGGISARKIGSTLI